MKRDPEIIRQICLAMEAMPAGEWLIEIDGIEPEEFAQHTELLIDAGLVIASVKRMLGGHADVEIERLTWLGHDFAEACRSPGIWERAKKSVIAPGAAWTLDLLKEWLKAEVGKGFSALG